MARRDVTVSKKTKETSQQPAPVTEVRKTPRVATHGPSEYDRIRHPEPSQETAPEQSQPKRSAHFERNERREQRERHEQREQREQREHHEPRAERPAFVENYQLPQNYNSTQVVLLPRDPHWVHAYWNVAANTIDEIRQAYGSGFDKSMFTLRLYDITAIDFNGQNANRVIDIPVGGDARNWYLNMWCDNVTYCADFGIRTHDADFVPIARSNIVATPRLGYSDRSDMIWMEVKDARVGRPFILLDREKLALLSRKRKLREGAQTPRYRRKRLELTEDDIRAYYSRLFPRLRRIMAARLRQGRYGIDRRKWKFYLKSGLLLEDLLLSGLSYDEAMRRIRLGASEEMAQKQGGSESVTSRGGASERESKRRQFFFELWTELIVYGRTEPDARVWHGGKEVKLRADGTFSLRFALPESTAIPLDFLAQSNDTVESRRIATAADRTGTAYS
ncbi:MAG: DUF4912 domain-containing protein [Candidatus Omnitrophica bacterium]|nr:DUF4912 domain-containing protein [Candidatus Omnitrophota bacterium]